jgi:hypothetical protein
MCSMPGMHLVLAEELQIGLKAETVTQRERLAPSPPGMLTSSSGL